MGLSDGWGVKVRDSRASLRTGLDNNDDRNNQQNNNQQAEDD
jgi:hypothetical protein